MAPSFAGWAIPPKDDLEHLPKIDFEKGRNLRQPPPVRSGVPMANGTDRVVLISGASSGIGRAIAELLASRGYRVFAGVRASAAAFPLPAIEVLSLDVCDEASVNACVAEVYNRAGRIDVLINNA